MATPFRRNSALLAQPNDTNEILKKLLAHKLAPEHKIHSTVLQISLCMPRNYYVQLEDAFVFIIDISSTKYTRDEIIHYILPKLRDSLLLIGISAVFAMETGPKYDENGWIFRYEDYNLHRIISKCQEKNTEYAKLLKIYLQNNMNIADTIRSAYIHRNTFIYRIKSWKNPIKSYFRHKRRRNRRRLSFIRCLNSAPWKIKKSMV